MKSRREFLKGAAILSSVAPFSLHLSRTSTAEEATRVTTQDSPEAWTKVAQADSVVEFISIQTHLNWRHTVWDQAAWRPFLGELGVRYTRSSVGNKVARDHLSSLHNEYGISCCALFNQVNKDGSFKLDETLDEIAFIRDEIGAKQIQAIEGPNEYTHKHKTDGWADRLKSYQKFLYDHVRSDAGLAQKPILAPTIWKRNVEEYKALADMSAWADYGNLHLYNGGRKPSLLDREKIDAPIDTAIDDARVVTPGKQICITETGFNVADGPSSPRWAVPADVAAKYSLRNLGELFLRRDTVKWVNVYTLIDDEHEDARFGLLDSNLTPRPAYDALKNFIALVADPGPEFVPDVMPCKIEASDPSLRWFALQKRNKNFLLVLWLDAESYSRKKGVAVTVAPATVTIDFSGNINSLSTYTPTTSNQYLKQHKQVSSVNLEIPDHLTVVEVQA